MLAEALERWPQTLVQQLLPRIWQIIVEISNRWQRKVEDFYHDMGKTQTMAIVWGGEVRMANLCIAGGMAVNGVSALHSEILRKDVFRDACGMEPQKFQNVTNGIDHRRWLSEINPGLDSLVQELTGGDGYLTKPQLLKKLDDYADDAAVLERLGKIKQANKESFAAYAKKTQGVVLDPNAIFDVQVKRLHEYKRQLLNVLHIISLYQDLQNDPNAITQPHTFLFGAKAAPGYAVAKRIIRLINSLADQIAHDPICKDKLQVVFLENYRVSLAEKLMPASEVSQQISTAGKEASGTGNMKFMMNGALTIGTLDGANVEMAEEVGAENMFIFGASSDEIINWENQGGYNPMEIFNSDQEIRRVLMQLINGSYSPQNPELFRDIYNSLLNTQSSDRADTYFILKDFRSYAEAEDRIDKAYRDEKWWARTAILNTASSGKFSSDRTIEEYVRDIWHLDKIKVEL